MKCLKKIMAVTMACTMLCATNIVAFAGSVYNQKAGYAGSIRVTAEVGFNGTNAYAKVSALANVDATMEGTVSYNNGADIVTMFGAFNQKTYGEASRTCPGEVYKATCLFTVNSDDGTWSVYGVAE